MEDVKKEEFLSKDEFRQKIQDCIDDVNSHLHHTEEVQKFIIVPNQPTVESGELTPTMKIKRSVVEDKYSKEIEQLYKNKKGEKDE
jgi:long-chain acyl-CoA synthetase